MEYYDWLVVCGKNNNTGMKYSGWSEKDIKRFFKNPKYKLFKPSKLMKKLYGISDEILESFQRNLNVPE